MSAQQQREVYGGCQSTEQSLLDALNSILAIGQDLQASFDASVTGLLDASIGFDGGTGSGSSVLVFDGGTGQGSALLVFEGSGGSGSSVLVFDGTGGSGSSLLTFDGGGGSGSSVLTFDGSGGSGSSVLTFGGGGGNGSSILVPPPPLAGAVGCTLAFDGSGSGGGAIAPFRPLAQQASNPRKPRSATLCVRRRAHAKRVCVTLRQAPVPLIASLRTRITHTGKHTITLHLTTAGRMLLVALREADHLYHQHHPNGHHPPRLRFSRPQLQTTLALPRGAHDM